MTVTLDELIDRVRILSDTENAESRHPDSEITRYLNTELAELHRLLVNRFEDELITSVDLNLTGTTYVLADDVTKIRGVDRIDGGGITTPMKSLPFAQRGDRSVTFDVLPYPFVSPTSRWTLVGRQLRFSPADRPPGDIRLWYVQAAPTLVSGSTDSITVPYTTNGYEEYIVYGAVKKVLARDDEDTSQWAMLKEELKQDIKASAATRDASGLERVAHVQQDWDDWDW